MKKLNFIKRALLQGTFAVIILLVASCNDSYKSEDSKDVAEEHNDAKFDNDQKEEDAQFLVDASEVNLSGIQLGQLAQQKGTAVHVKELGKMMEDEHTKSQRDLVALAKSKRMSIPTSPTEDANDAYMKLDKKQGSDFDKAYADKMVDKHENAIETFEKAAKNSNDTEIRNWAKSSLPELRSHLDDALECQKKCEKN